MSTVLEGCPYYSAVGPFLVHKKSKENDTSGKRKF